MIHIRKTPETARHQMDIPGHAENHRKQQGPIP